MIQAAPSRVLSWTCCVGAGLQVDGFDNLRSPGVAELRKRSSQASAAPTRDSIRARLEWLFHEPGASSATNLWRRGCGSGPTRTCCGYSR